MTETPAPEQPQRVISQCVLLSAMSKLSTLYNNYLNSEEASSASTGDIYPKNGKIIRLQTQNPAIVTTKLSGCSYSNLAKKLTPKHLSLLVPRLNITKVIYKEPDNSETIDVPMSFEQNEAVGTDFNSNLPMLDSKIHRGFGIGVESFSWEYAGTSPATARKDVKGTLTITANSFAELMKERRYNHPDEGMQTYRFIDLVTHPSHIIDDDDQPQAAGTPTIYDARDYKIRIEAGWYPPDASIKPLFYDLFDSNVSNRDEELDSFFSCMTEVLLLTLNDHDINIEENGRVKMTITYRAYVEESIQGPLYNVLYPTQELFDKYNELKGAFVEITSQCNQLSSEDDQPDSSSLKADLDKAGENYASQIGSTKYEGMQAIIKKLNENGRVFHVTLNKEQLAEYIQLGLDLGRLVYADGSSGLDSTADAIEADIDAAGDLDTQMLLDLSKGELEDFTASGTSNPNPDVEPITYFFMGDLLDVVYANYVYTGGPDKLKLILPDFPHRSDNTIKYTNIAHIPITLDYFIEWWATQVIAKDVETYSLMDFLRNMTQTMISDLLGRDCVKNRVDFVSNFQIAFLKSLNTFDDIDSNGSFLFEIDNVPTGYLSINETVDTKDVTNYLIIYPSNTLYLETETDPVEKLANDEERGVIYLSIGSKTGFVKTINFSKQDIPSLREARFEAYGISNPLAQLSNVYNADVTLYGIPNFYPGNRVFIDPFSLGIGFPWIPEQPAFNLGIGGYHIVVRVNSQISRGEYTTSLSCRWESSDGKKRLFDGPVDAQAGTSNPAAGSFEMCTQLLESFNSTYGNESDGS